jgi:hypothetical protein
VFIVGVGELAISPESKRNDNKTKGGDFSLKIWVRLDRMSGSVRTAFSRGHRSLFAKRHFLEGLANE